MSSQIIELKEFPAIKAAIKRAAPSYRKHKAILFTCNNVEISGGYWDGGSRYGFLMCDVDGHNVESIPTSTAPPQFGGDKPKTIPVPGGKMILKLGTFRGKQAVLTIYCSDDIAGEPTQ